jgi:hypothetical protein
MTSTHFPVILMNAKQVSRPADLEGRLVGPRPLAPPGDPVIPSKRNPLSPRPSKTDPAITRAWSETRKLPYPSKV